MPYLFANNAASTLASAITGASTTLALSVGEGARFPAASGANTFVLSVQNGAVYEIMVCTSRSGDSLTVVRAQEGTPANSFAIGSSVEMRYTAGTAESFVQKMGSADVNITKPNPRFIANKAASGQESSIDFQTATVARWRVLSTLAAEGGANSGSDFGIARYNDAGAVLDTPLSINRASGDVALSAKLAVTSDITTNTAIIAPVLRGGTGGGGIVRAMSTANSIGFKWNGSSVIWNVDNTVEKAICTQNNAKDLELYTPAGGSPTNFGLALKDIAGVSYSIHCDIASDERIKYNITLTEVDALAVINNIAVCSYSIYGNVAGRMRAVGKSEEETAVLVAEAAPEHVRIGVIAQNFMQHIPEGVTVREQPDDSPFPKDMHFVNEGAAMPYLLRAVQQLSKQVVDLKAQVALLSGK